MHKHSYTNTVKSGSTRHHGQAPEGTQGSGSLTLGALVMGFATGRQNALKTKPHQASGIVTYGSLDPKTRLNYAKK